MAMTPNIITVDLVVDTSRVSKALKELSDAVERAASKMAKVMDAFGWAAERRLTNYQDREKRREVFISGMEARYYVRGGLEARTEEDITALVQDTWRDRYRMDLTEPEARRLMVAAMTGWAQHSRHGLVCLDCEGLGEWETDSIHPAYRRSQVCHACDGTGEWDPGLAKGVTTDITWAFLLRRFRSRALGWAAW